MRKGQFLQLGWRKFKKLENSCIEGSHTAVNTHQPPGFDDDPPGNFFKLDSNNNNNNLNNNKSNQIVDDNFFVVDKSDTKHNKHKSFPINCLVSKNSLLDADISNDHDPLNQILFTDSVNAVTRERPRKIPQNRAEMIDIINRPYAEALADVNLEGDNIVDVAKTIKNRLAKYKDIQISLSLEELARLSPKVSASLSQFFSRTESALPILVASTVNLFNTGTECTYIHITVNHKKVIAILDTGAPENIVFTKLMKSIRLAPDVDYKKSFGTAGPNVTWAVGAYSALTLKFRKPTFNPQSLFYITITMTYSLELVYEAMELQNYFG